MFSYKSINIFNINDGLSHDYYHYENTFLQNLNGQNINNEPRPNNDYFWPEENQDKQSRIFDGSAFKLMNSNDSGYFGFSEGKNDFGSAEPCQRIGSNNSDMFFSPKHGMNNSNSSGNFFN